MFLQSTINNMQFNCVKWLQLLTDANLFIVSLKHYTQLISQSEMLHNTQMNNVTQSAK